MSYEEPSSRTFYQQDDLEQAACKIAVAAQLIRDTNRSPVASWFVRKMLAFASWWCLRQASKL